MRYTNQTFTTDVTLDGNEYIDCEIKDCIVFFNGGTYVLVRTKLTNVRYGLRGAANQTLMFLRMIRATSAPAFESLFTQDQQLILDKSVTIN